MDATGGLSFPSDFSEYETERAAAVSTYETQQIDALQSVRRFRDHFLRGRTLSPDEAYLFFNSESGAPPISVELLDELTHRADQLAKRYAWEPAEAQWFLLTGFAPIRRPVEISYEHERVCITAEPWVPAETVVQVYRQYQRLLLGGENRAIGLDKIALFNFVVERSPDNTRPRWGALLEAWNSTHAERRYSNEKLLARDFARVKRALLAKPVTI